MSVPVVLRGKTTIVSPSPVVRAIARTGVLPKIDQHPTLATGIYDIPRLAKRRFTMVACTSRFDYSFASLGDLEVETAPHPETAKPVVSAVIVDGEPAKPTNRFWLSLYARYGFNKSFFKYFAHEEVFRRISQVESQDRVRLCIERDQQTGESRLLAASNPTKPVLHPDDLLQTLESYEGDNIRYANGIIESSHVPRLSGNTFEVGGDAFCNRFVISAPIDGYGLPSIYLSLLRQVCSNGMVGYSPTFRSTLALGRAEDNAIFAIVRALDGFNSDEGYAALRQRFEAAAKSWASVYEAQSLHGLLVRLLARGEIRRQMAGDAISSAAEVGQGNDEVMQAFHRMTGDVSQIYGLANLDALSVKRQRTLPVNCRVYDLLNFVSELATHYASGSGSRMAQAWLGTLVSHEFDLENSCDAFDDFQDFFLDRKLNGEVAMDLQRIGG